MGKGLTVLGPRQLQAVGWSLPGFPWLGRDHTHVPTYLVRSADMLVEFGRYS